MHYFDIHKGIKAYCKRMVETARESGSVETLFGFKRSLPNINSPYRQAAEAEERMAINTPVQGTAAEILKLAMIKLHSQLNDKFLISNVKLNSKSQMSKSHETPRSDSGQAMEQWNNEAKARLLLTVHDELVVEAPADQAEKVAKIVKETMESVIKLCVPVEVDIGIGNNWAETK